MKILILSTNTGGGHNAAGNAMIDALAELGVRAEMVDSLAIASEWGSKTVSGVYASVARHSPRVFGAGYRVVGKLSPKHGHSASYALNLVNIRRLEEYLFQTAPDAIITTHVFSSQALTHLIKRGKIGALTFGIMTDYNVTLFWEETRLDAYILPHPDLVAPYMAKGMPAKRLFPYGIPVTPQIAPERDIAAAKRAYGIDPECKHVIVAGGSMGAGKLPRTVRALDETLPSSVVISAVCGNNAAAKEELEAMGNPRVRVLGYVSPLNAFLASADVVITKAGGLTSTETLVQRVPLIALHSIPPIETDNAAFFQARGLAYNAKNDEKACRAAVKILYDPNVQAGMLHAARQHIPKDASRRVARLIVNSVEHGKITPPEK